MSHVKGYSKRTKSGMLVFVKEHNDKRSKHSKKNVYKHIVKIDPGMVKMREYVTGLLRTPDGQKEFEDKIKQGQFMKALPEVVELYGVEQGAHHRIIDAFGHTMEVLRKLPKDATDNQRWAAVLHDIGKVPQQKFDKNRGVVFDGHEYAGYKMVKKVLDRLAFDKEDKEEISFLVLHHGDLRTKLLHGDQKEAKEFTKEKHFESLLTVHNADVVASGRDPKEVNNAAKEIKAGKEIKKSVEPKTWFQLGNIVADAYTKEDRIGKTTVLRPNREILKGVAKKMGISLSDAQRALAIYNSPDPKEEQKWLKDRKVPELNRPKPDDPESYVGKKWKWHGGEREVMGVHSSGQLEVKTIMADGKPSKFGVNLIDPKHLKDMIESDKKGSNRI